MARDLSSIAREYKIPVAELNGIVSFYTLFSREPRGRHVIRLCDSLSCRICGSLDIYRYIRKRLGISCGMTTGDGLFTLVSLSIMPCTAKKYDIYTGAATIFGASGGVMEAALRTA